MSIWYETRVKFTKEFQDGTLKRITEAHLMNAASYTDAEKRVYEEIGEFIRGEFLIVGIKPANFIDIFEYDDSETWWSAKVQYTTEDDSGREKNISNMFLVTAPDMSQAYDRIEDSLKGLMSVFEITEIKKSNIVEVHPMPAEEAETGSKSKSKKK